MRKQNQFDMIVGGFANDPTNGSGICPPQTDPESATLEKITGIWSLLIALLGAFGNAATLAAVTNAYKAKRYRHPYKNSCFLPILVKADAACFELWAQS